MDVRYWPNFHVTKTTAAFYVVLSATICHSVVTQSPAVRRLLSAESGRDECGALETSSNYSGHCHCSSLLDIHCSGLDQIPRFASNNITFSAINMADQLITDVPQSAVGDLKVRIMELLLQIYYAALLPSRGPHYASHSICPSVCLSVRLSVRPSRYRYRASRRAT